MSIDFSKFEPASKADAAAAGLLSSPAGMYPAEAAASSPGGVPAAVAAAPPPAASAPGCIVAFAEGGPARHVPVTLGFPIVVDGVRVDTVVVRRLRVAEVRAYVAAVQAGQEASLPMYERPDGVPLPQAALDALDSDDFDKLDAAAVDFLPLALRGDPTSA
ncbi:phage tail assembly protein [Methylobacterium aquaticum]|uniref:phage tail assembly protein n=1 Tax=Methylobacterium aquaticum TaxID=270351 RepID=UPI0019314DB7|nr:phage tail assembly protein [Methylobacterium aquaticum]QRE78242.1 hypothetical protein F1D61_32975 [Methylobacterium aquaticum]QRE78262.1 hypothetical protein F1D61_33085 [Methylobacterium aquaticum]